MLPMATRQRTAAGQPAGIGGGWGRGSSDPRILASWASWPETDVWMSFGGCDFDTCKHTMCRVQAPSDSLLDAHECIFPQNLTFMVGTSQDVRRGGWYIAIGMGV